jgi:hypothetical protein
MALSESLHSDNITIQSVYPHDFLDLVYDVFESQSIMNRCKDVSRYA